MAGAPAGSTDSERYFLYLLQCAEAEGDLVRGFRRGVTDVVGACGDASLNAVLLSPGSLVVVHGRAGLEPPHDDLLDAVERPEDIPATTSRVTSGSVTVAPATRS